MNERTIKTMLEKRSEYIRTLEMMTNVNVHVEKGEKADYISVSANINKASLNESVKIANFILNRFSDKNKKTVLNIFNYMF